MFGSSRFTDHYTPQQNEAFEGAMDWHRQAMKGNAPQVYRIFGYAGTGKTTTAKRFAQAIKGQTCYAAFTGKAALQLRLSGCPEAQTLHSAMYVAQEESDGGIRYHLNPESPFADADLIAVDEVSMVDEEIGSDLMKFNRPILVLGDPGQLQPIRSAGYFTREAPDHLLTEIHRQAAGNPIIKLANEVRHGRDIELGEYGACRIVERGTLTNEEVLSADQLMVGKNVTREGFNKKIRRLLGRAGDLPEHGDRLVCLRNSQSDGQKLLNGAMYRVARCEGVSPQHVKLRIISEDFPNQRPIEVKVCREFFEGGWEGLTHKDKRSTDEFCYGYAITVHKAQGSSFRNPILYDESSTFREDWSRWLYTGITRASERLTIVK